MFIRSPKDLASGLFLLAFGGLLASLSVPLSLWTQGGPEAGFFPFVIALLIIAFSLVVIGYSLGFSAAQKDEKTLEARGKDPAGLLRVLAYAILMLAYGLLVETLGFLIISAVLLFLILKLLEKQNWKRAIVVGLSSILVAYFLFKHLLGVPLPAGLLKWW